MRVRALGLLPNTRMLLLKRVICLNTDTTSVLLRDKNARELFEYQQSELEEYTEKLNKLTEGSHEALEANKLRVRTQYRDV